MTYQDFLTQKHFNQEELIAFAYGTLVDDPPADFDARLPAPPFLMIDRVLSFVSDGKRGSIIAEQDVRMDAWYFQCHMPNDPVHPGCLCVDAIWQLLGFYGVWRGALGAGRALGCGEVSFSGQIRPYNRSIRYEIAIKRFAHLNLSGATIIIGDGNIFVDDALVVQITEARTGVFKGIVYPDYPKRSRNAVGGLMSGSEI